MAHKDYEGNRHRGIAIARQVSAILKRAGFPKAGPYHPFGDRSAGYIAAETGNGTHDVPTAVILWATGSAYGLTNAAHLEALAEPIRVDGRFSITVSMGSIEVTRTITTTTTTTN